MRIRHHSVTTVTFIYIVTVVTYMDVDSKVIKLNTRLYEQILEIGDMKDVIKRLVVIYKTSKVSIRSEFGKFHIKINGKEELFDITGSTKPVRVDYIVYSLLNDSKIVPTEDFSSVVFRLLTCYKYRTRKPILLFFHGDICTNCRLVEHNISRFLAVESNKNLVNIAAYRDLDGTSLTNSVFVAYGVQCIPVVHFLNPDGNIVLAEVDLIHEDGYGILQKTALDLHSKYNNTRN